MINCYIIGELSSVEPLYAFIKNHSLTELKGYSIQKPERFNPVFSLRPELVFIDDKLFSCNETWVDQIKQFAAIVILSNGIDNAFKAFENQAFDYILKPIPYSRFVQCINKFNHVMQLASGSKQIASQPISDSFFIKADAKGTKQILIRCADLIYVEALQNYVILHLENDKRFCCHNTMKEMEESLPERDFIRVHKSYIINHSKIMYINGNEIALRGIDGHKVLVGNTYKKAFLDKNNQMLIKRQKQSTPIINYAENLASVILYISILSTLILL